MAPSLPGWASLPTPVTSSATTSVARHSAEAGKGLRILSLQCETTCVSAKSGIAFTLDPV